MYFKCITVDNLNHLTVTNSKQAISISWAKTQCTALCPTLYLDKK